MEFYKRLGGLRRRRFRRLEQCGMDGEEDMERERKRSERALHERKKVIEREFRFLKVFAFLDQAKE